MKGENEAMRDYNLTGEVWECFPKEGLFNKEKINLFCFVSCNWRRYIFFII